MKHYFSLIEYALWVSIIFFQFVACWILFRRKIFFNSWKVFRYYLFYMAGQSVVLLALSFLVGPTSMYYAVGYYLVDFIEAILINLVVLEILVKAWTRLNRFQDARLPGSALVLCWVFPQLLLCR